VTTRAALLARTARRRNYRVAAGLDGEPPTHFRDRSMFDGARLTTMVRWLNRGYAFAPHGVDDDLGGHDVGDLDEDVEFDPIAAPVRHHRGPVFVPSLHTIWSRLRDAEPEAPREPVPPAEVKRLRLQASSWNRSDKAAIREQREREQREDHPGLTTAWS
jgi:hypothetical protein